MLDLPLTNRDAAAAPGGVNAALPTVSTELEPLVEEARESGVAPSRYAALLYQYWLVRATERAGIDLAAWDPRAGVAANEQNLLRSYRLYEDFQLSHRELQWAGMGGLVGSDFGGGLLYLDLANTLYALPGLQESSRAIVGQVVNALGVGAVEELPRGLRALASAGGTISSADLNHFIGMILVMQKNIFSDVMPMHVAYTTAGMDGLSELHAAGLFDDSILGAWRDIASQEPGRIAQGNATLLRREQLTVIGNQWDEVRNYKGDIGEGLGGVIAS